MIFEPKAAKQLPRLKRWDFGNMPVCMAKNQYSLSDDAKKLGRPTDFDIHIREAWCECRSRICGSTDRGSYDDAWSSKRCRLRIILT